MATTYVKELINVGDGLSLYVDGNSKITVGNGSYEVPVPNALSLPHISTCPGATEDCMKSCYVYGLQKHAPEVYAEYCKNERVMHRILMSESSMYDTAAAFAAWIGEHCSDGFRWHVSGDVMNDRHARWIAKVAKFSSNVRHWIYTRTFDVVQDLDAKNLAVNLSADSRNYRKAKELYDCWPGLRICYLTCDGTVPDDLPSGSVIFPDYDLRARDGEDKLTGKKLEKMTDHSWWQGLSQEHRRMVCPPDFFGQSERHRCGPCSKCLYPAKNKQ